MRNAVGTPTAESSSAAFWSFPKLKLVLLQQFVVVCHWRPTCLIITVLHHEQSQPFKQSVYSTKVKLILGLLTRTILDEVS